MLSVLSYVMLLAGSLQAGVAQSLEISSLYVPSVVFVGDIAALFCKHDLKHQSLYSVMWLKDDEIFYRFVPGQIPQKHVYSIPGLQIDTDLSTDQTVVLTNVSVFAEGRYRCEVSAEAPSFTTGAAEANLNIIALPEGGPILEGLQEEYEVGDSVLLNCTSMPSHPVAEIYWFLNGKQIKGSSQIMPGERSLESRISWISWRVEDEHLASGQLIIQCLSLIPALRGALQERVLQATVIGKEASLFVFERSNATAVAWIWKVLIVISIMIHKV